MSGYAKIVKELECYDFIHFNTSDVHGISRGKYIPARHASTYLDTGLPICGGLTAMGPHSQLDVDCLKELGQSRCGDYIMRPAHDGIFPHLWTWQGKHRVGEIICETYWSDGSSQRQCPRYVARRQLDTLADMGLSVLSSCECEFVMLKTSTLATPAADSSRTDGPQKDTSEQQQTAGYDFYSTLLFSEEELFFCEVDTFLKAADIDIEAVHTENYISQYEIILKPRFGIAGADQVHHLRDYLKEIARQQGRKVSFMTQYEPEQTIGLHFNHSLWNSANENVLNDPDQPHGLSLLAQHWLGGLTAHAPALTALCSPTVNCYRRLNNKWMPTRGSWGIDDRYSVYRVKNLTAASTYVENRLPGGSANPYLVLAGTLAAGIDGLTKRLPCPAQMDTTVPALPRTLAEALDALERDDVMVQALGEDFVNTFVTIKRKYELAALKSSDVSNCDGDVAGLTKEKLMYFDLL